MAACLCSRNPSRLPFLNHYIIRIFFQSIALVKMKLRAASVLVPLRRVKALEESTSVPNKLKNAFRNVVAYQAIIETQWESASLKPTVVSIS